MNYTTQIDEIDRYLQKVFGNLDFDYARAAVRIQERLGVEVKPDEADLLFTCSALALMSMDIGSTSPVSALGSCTTRVFRNACRRMREDIELRLREEVSRLEQEGLTHPAAVSSVIRAASTVKDLQRSVALEADRVFQETVLEPAYPREKNRSLSIVAWTLTTGLFVLGFFLPYHNQITAAGVVESSVTATAFGVAIATLLPGRLAKAPIEEDFRRFAAKAPLIGASSLQKLRFVVFKLAIRPNSVLNLGVIAFGFASFIMTGLECG